MCGIAGLIGRLTDANRAALACMNSTLAHRGPDGEGDWYSPGNDRGWGVLLTHRRLSILDLSPAGAQPMVDPGFGNVITFNGEIYNFVAIRDELTAAGQSFQSTGDTAVMLRDYSPTTQALLGTLFTWYCNYNTGNGVNLSTGV